MFKGKRQRKDYIDDTTYGYQGRPETEGTVKDHISVKSMKDLPHSSYSLLADPYTAALPTSEPYPILNKFNRIVGGNYGGEDNIDGGNVQQYANSTVSKFLDYFDELRLKINTNYRYLPILSSVDVLSSNSNLELVVDKVTLLMQSNYIWNNPTDRKVLTYNGSVWKDSDGTTITLSAIGITIDSGTPASSDKLTVIGLRSYAGIQMIEEQRKSVAESVSILQSTTYTQMAINNFAIETDLPLGTAKMSDISNAQDGSVMAYTNLTDVLYGISIYYQLFLQNALNVMNWHNSFRIKQGTMIRNAWNREVPSLNAFFGLMNKKAFLSMLDSINLSFEGEYIDKDFMEQINLLTTMPSRRSNSITDPILELQCGFNHPTVFKVYVLDSNGQIAATIYDDADLSLVIPFEDQGDQAITFWQACDHLRDYLSMEATQRWARRNFTPANIDGTDNARYNQIKYLFDVIVASFTYFKPNMSDFREAFDVMARTGTISWTKGFRPSVIKDTDAQLFWNVLTDHVYQMIMAGAHELNYDEATKRWRTFSLWNMYSGIPSYDVKNGGAFLTLSFKEFGSGVETAEQYEYLPLLFDTWAKANGQVVCVALSRKGKEAIITQSHTNINNNTVLTRLAPLVSQNGLDIRVPSIDYSNNNTLTANHFSSLYKTLTQIFGLCRIQTTNNGPYDYALDPDILAIYQIEISDITNVAITYARANAPFRGTTSKEGVLGFLSLSR